MPQPFDAESRWNELAPQIGQTIRRRKQRQIALRVATLLLLASFISGIGSYVYLESPIEVRTLAQSEVVSLPDGSEVTLNQHSTLTYPRSFYFASSRQVQLDGEGYFSIRPNQEKPFIISSPHHQTTVLGTSFLLKDRTKSTKSELLVTSGTVRFTHTESRESRIVQKTEQVSTRLTSRQMVHSVAKDANELAWMTGELSFNDYTLREVIPVLQKYFNLQIRIEDPSLYQLHFSGKFSKPSWNEVMDVMEYSMGLRSEKRDQVWVLYRANK
jgi:transmembrane sensor